MTLAILAVLLTQPPATWTTEVVPASPADGFHWAYVLRLPPDLAARPSPVLMVEPNNSGHLSDDPAEHLAAAKALAATGVGGKVSAALGHPLLMPAFPRSKELYTHSLNRRVLEVTGESLKRLDRQLLAMAKHARGRLASRGVSVPERVLLTGFSASATFATRLTALHPGAVRAVAAGGLNGVLVVPRAELGGDTLPFPVGVADVQAFTGRPFDLAAWKRVPQFLFMGAKDANDAVPNDDAYTWSEREVIYRRLGERMQPARWERCQALYREAGAAATFRTYPGVGHGTNGPIHAEIADFFRGVLAQDSPAEAGKLELRIMAGTWKSVSAENNGFRSSEADLVDTRRTLDADGKWTLKRGDTTVLEWRVKRLDPTTTPKQLDIEVASGEHKGTVYLAIYELDGDTLRICFAMPDKPVRPTEFTAGKGSVRALSEFKRVKE